MTSCRHMNLVLLPDEKPRLRCTHCHLVLSPEELQGGFCPECYEVQGKKRYDFDEIRASNNQKTRYRCEDCGAIIEVD